MQYLCGWAPKGLLYHFNSSGMAHILAIQTLFSSLLHQFECLCAWAQWPPKTLDPQKTDGYHKVDTLLSCAWFLYFNWCSLSCSLICFRSYELLNKSFRGREHHGINCASRSDDGPAVSCHSNNAMKSAHSEAEGWHLFHNYVCKNMHYNFGIITIFFTTKSENNSNFSSTSSVYQNHQKEPRDCLQAQNTHNWLGLSIPIGSLVCYGVKPIKLVSPGETLRQSCIHKTSHLSTSSKHLCSPSADRLPVIQNLHAVCGLTPRS